MSLLEQIAAISDEALIAWERLAGERADLLDCVPWTGKDSPSIYQACLNDDDVQRPFIERGGILLGVYVEEVQRWFLRLAGETTYELFENRARQAIISHKEFV